MVMMPAEQAARTVGPEHAVAAEELRPENDPLRLLLSRYDASVLDGSQEGACVRIAVSGESEWDVVLADGRARVEVATAPSPEPTSSASPRRRSPVSPWASDSQVRPGE